MTINLSIDNPCEVIINSFNILNSWSQLLKDAQVDESGHSSSSSAVFSAAMQKFLNNIDSPTSYSKIDFLNTMGIQIPSYLSYSLYKFYFYQIKDISDFTDSTALSIQLDKTKQIADKAIQEYQDCMKLLDNGVHREVSSFFPDCVLNYLYGYEFVNITTIIEPERKTSSREYVDYLINQFPEEKLKNFCLVAKKLRNFNLLLDSWSIVDLERLKVTKIPAEIYVKVHHRAIEEIKYLLLQHADNRIDKKLIEEDFNISEFFQIHKKRVEAYEQH
ncbi:Uncharacterized protein PRO82_001352 [Candidatus Protochlamydia amoebophila]|uniref:hypothetical protein n=1 Tax=Candidatus Protochlamydia amoebophila TaxID=362787 RepID=UPI001BC9E7F6|nr:hypothetical protein [Candidatus Protochlamydia amoebophila]MBS4164039.1 Uncharacterized protein [Candidatus Protochlamydia amoebophila]